MSRIVAELLAFAATMDPDMMNPDDLPPHLSDLTCSDCGTLAHLCDCGCGRCGACVAKHKDHVREKYEGREPKKRPPRSRDAKKARRSRKAARKARKKNR